jgi:hypothetical protein
MCWMKICSTSDDAVRAKVSENATSADSFNLEKFMGRHQTTFKVNHDPPKCSHTAWQVSSSSIYSTYIN